MLRKIGLYFMIMSSYLFSNSQLLESEYSDYMIKESQKYAVYACLANKIYGEGNSTVGKRCTCINSTWILKHYISQKNGFQAGLYYNPKVNQYIISIGGTTANPKGLSMLGKVGGSILDVGTDLLLLSNYNLIYETQSQSAIDYLKHKEVKNKKIDVIVGHSLGGGLAAYAGLYYGIPTYTFNPSPIPITNKSIDLFLKNHTMTISGKTEEGKVTNISFPNANKITNIMSGDDPVSNISFLLENTDKKYYNANDSSTKWNAFKLMGMFIPIELHLDYANQGHNIWFNKLMTGHSMDALAENMKTAKEIGDYNAYIKKWAYLTKKVRRLQKLGFKATVDVDSQFNYGEGIVFNNYYPTEKASQNVVIDDIRTLYNQAMGINYYSDNIKFINFLGLTDKIDMPKSGLEQMQNVDTNKYDDYISYKEYMLIAESTYKKIFGGQSFFSNIRRKTKSYLVFDKKYSKYVTDIAMRSIYGHIFVLHFVGGTPKSYLENDAQSVNNSFVIKFLERFHDVVYKYREKIIRN